VALPAVPDPEFAPPAASTAPDVADVLVLPDRPVASAPPVLDVDEPVLFTVVPMVAELVAPADVGEPVPEVDPVADPVVAEGAFVFATLVVVLVPMALALPVLALACPLSELVLV
jgi:hypothetical protein